MAGPSWSGLALYKHPGHSLSPFGVYMCNSFLFLESFLYLLPLVFTWKTPIHLQTSAQVSFIFDAIFVSLRQGPLFCFLNPFTCPCSSSLYHDQNHHELGNPGWFSTVFLLPTTAPGIGQTLNKSLMLIVCRSEHLVWTQDRITCYPVCYSSPETP